MKIRKLVSVAQFEYLQEGDIFEWNDNLYVKWDGQAIPYIDELPNGTAH